ncbi:MAG: hypothetical protein GTO63_18145 [Anaerolineae bacterium]|nr:hypothetical protein [Anaerolineae bacterium]NIN96692.1 hypothetical protein [Anaerolineae bacterium]NIQ79703.1 hypothetical protein [Anaerolineae bacterium]
MPENRVKIEGDSCVMKRDYASTDLSVVVGEVPSVELEESAWAWATKEGRESGWVPLEILERG